MHCEKQLFGLLGLLERCYWTRLHFLNTRYGHKFQMHRNNVFLGTVTQPPLICWYGRGSVFGAAYCRILYLLQVYHFCFVYIIEMSEATGYPVYFISFVFTLLHTKQGESH